MSVYDTPTEKCPYCGAECHAHFVDIGVGMQQASPYHCHECHATQISAYDGHDSDDFRPLTKKEKQIGWYAPLGDENVK